MSSPLIRRLRLGEEIRKLRADAGLTSDQFARKAGLTRIEISRLENGERRPDPNKVMACLDAAEVREDTEHWRLLVRLSRDANRRGWWDAREFAATSEQQRISADIESGATAISVYHNFLVPGLLQTSAYIGARDQAMLTDGWTANPVSGSARLRRQSELVRSGGPLIEVLLEEQVIRRVVAPAAVDGRAGRLPDRPDSAVRADHCPGYPGRLRIRRRAGTDVAIRPAYLR